MASTAISRVLGLARFSVTTMEASAPVIRSSLTESTATRGSWSRGASAQAASTAAENIRVTRARSFNITR
jgi:hypothetical protein